MASSTPVSRHAPKKVMPLQLATSQGPNTRRSQSLRTPPTSASLLSPNSLTTRTHSGRLSPAQIDSFKAKISTFSTDTSAAYTRSPAFLAFLNNIENSSRNDTQAPGHDDAEKENLKIPVHINVLKKGSFEIPFGIPRSPRSLAFECEMIVGHPRRLADKDDLDTEVGSEASSSTSLLFTIEVNFLDGTADIVLLSPIPSKMENIREEDIDSDSTTPTDSQMPLAPSGSTRSHRQNRSGGWYMKSPETGLFAPL